MIWVCVVVFRHTHGLGILCALKWLVYSYGLSVAPVAAAVSPELL